MSNKFHMRLLKEKLIRKLLCKENVLRKLLYMEEGEYVAHCLEFDLVTTSTKSFEEASMELNELVESYVSYAHEYDNFENLYRLAPFKYWIMLQFATRYEDCLEHDKQPIKIRDKIYSIEAAAA